jgi:hypothetical protein
MAKLNKYGKPWKTFQQWKRQHPKGTRKQYNAYRARQRTAGGAMSQPAMAPLTNQQLQLLATQMAQADLLPQQQALDRERQRALEQAKNQQSLIAGLTAATGGIVGQIAPTIDDAYRQAAQDQAGFAQGFAGDMQQIAEQQAAQNAADLSKWGAPAQQIANVEAAGQGAQDVLYGTQGYLPATTLGQQGAAMTAFGAQMPGIVTRMGQEDQRLVAYEAQQQARGFADQAAELAARLPGLRQQYIQDLLSQERDKVALQMALKELGLNAQAQKFGQQFDLARLDADIAADAADQAADAADRQSELRDARRDRNKARRERADKKAKRRIEAMQDAMNWVEDQLPAAGKTQDKIIGYQPVKGPDLVSPNGKIRRPQWYTRNGGLTTKANDPNILKRPIYEKVPVAKPQRQQIFNRVLQMLRSALGGGFSEVNIRRFASQIVNQYYTVATRPPIQSVGGPTSSY